MEAESLNCPEPDAIVEFADGALSVQRRDELRGHMESCDECLKAYALLASRRLSKGGARSSPRQDNVELRAGEQVGRFIVLHEVGRGGMGRVYAAYDPELDRKVALKLMHAAGKEANDGLLAEARLLAKISHPNVISIYEVGRVGGAVYMAMEYLAAASSSRQADGADEAELTAFIAGAARGLEAVHQSGLVHRDIKPSNLLVGPDGRAIVADFGLAGRESGGERNLVGTPAYMAPEHREGRATAASDQYSLCLTLLHLLQGELPTGIESVGKELSPRRRRVLARGLAPNPSERFEDMASFADALEAASKPRRLWLALPALLLGAAVALAFLSMGEKGSSPCATAEASWGELWSEQTRADLRARFDSLPGFGDELGTHVEAELDRYEHAWLTHRKSVCEEALIAKSLSEAEYAEQLACLEHGQVELRAVLSSLSRASDAELASAGDAVALLRDPARCRLGQGLGHLPVNEERAKTVREQREGIASFEAAASLGRLDEAARGLSELCARDEALSFGPLRSECSLALGRVESKRGELQEAERRLVAATTAGTESRLDHLVAQAWLDLSWLHGYHMEKLDEAGRDLEQGRAFVKRIGARDELPVLYERHAGWLALRRGSLDEALEHYREALRLAEEQDMAGRDLAMLLSDAGSAYLSMGKLEEAASHLGRAFDAMRKELGPRHPDTLTIHNNYAALLKEEGKLEEAIAEFEKARAGFEASFEDSELYVGQILNNLAVIYADQERYDKAESSYREAIDAFDTAYEGKEHANSARALHGLATVLTEAERYEEAEGLHRRSLAMKKVLLGDEHPSVAVGLSGLADLYERTGRLDEALAIVDEGLAMLRSTVGEEHPYTQYLTEQRAEFVEKSPDKR